MRPLRLAIPLALALAAACSSSSTATATLDGERPSKAYDLPTTALTTTTGAQGTLPSKPGTVTLVYVGYTGCPDVCPLIMADTALALRTVPSKVSSRVQVAFLTSDPRRDTPPVMKQWLAGFQFPAGTSVTGFTGDWSTLHSTATDIGVPLPPTEPATVEDVGHGSQLQAFVGGKAIELWLPSDPDHLARDIEHDLPLLLAKA